MNTKNRFPLSSENSPKPEIFFGVQGALEIEKPKLLNYIRNRYGISPQVVEEQFYDACQKLWMLYSDNNFVIEYTVIVLVNGSGEITTSQQVVTPSGYCVEAKQLAQVRSWVWTSVRYKALDYLKKDNGYSDVSLHDIENFIPLDDRSNPEEMYIANDIEDDTVVKSMEVDDEDRLGELASILSSIILGIKSDRVRSVINLTYLSNMTTKEIAEHLGMSESNVRTTRSRGMKRIKSQLEQYPEFLEYFN